MVCAARSQRRGFGLLEAIVALAILAGSGMALFSWIGQNLRETARIEEAQARAALQMSALDLIEGVNPFLEPKGERKLGALQVQWQAQEIEPMRPSIPFSATAVRWKVGLYRIDVRAADTSQNLRLDFAVERPGLERLGVLRPDPNMAPP